MLAAFWSIVALILTGVIIWLIFTNDETVKRILKLDDESQAAKAAAAKSAAVVSASDAAATPGVEEAMFDALDKPAAATAAAMVKATEKVEPALESASEQVADNFTANDPAAEGAGVEVREEAAQDPTEAAPPDAETPAIEASRSREIVVDIAAEESADDGAVDDEPVADEPIAAEPVAEEPAAEEKLQAAAETATEMAEEAAALSGATKVVAPTTDNYPDQLTKLNGIGEVYERRLYEAGIFTWYQISETSVSKLSTITQAIDAANVGDWPGQARRLAATEGRSGVRYSGPMPDKLTAIPGVGPGAEQQLRTHGIVTYHQLSIAPVVKVEAILGDAGKRADVPAIIAKAKELA